MIYKKDLDLFDFNKQIIPMIKNNHNNNCTTMIISLHIKGENNQNSFNLTLPDNLILIRNQDETLSPKIGDVCATKPDIEDDTLTTMAPTTILESHLNTKKVEGTGYLSV